MGVEFLFLKVRASPHSSMSFNVRREYTGGQHGCPSPKSGSSLKQWWPLTAQWDAPRIRDELLKLGFEVSERMVSPLDAEAGQKTLSKLEDAR